MPQSPTTMNEAYARGAVDRMERAWDLVLAKACAYAAADIRERAEHTVEAIDARANAERDLLTAVAAFEEWRRLAKGAVRP